MVHGEGIGKLDIKIHGSWANKEKQMKAVLVKSSGFPQAWARALIQKFPAVRFSVIWDNQESIKREILDAEILIGCPRRIFTPQLLAHASSLRWVHCGGAGVEEFIFPEFSGSEILFTNGRIIQGPEVADHAIALLLAVSRNLVFVLTPHRPKTPPRPLELRGKICVIFGMGGIGLCIAERLRAFGAKVIGVGNDLPPLLGFLDEFYGPNQLLQILPRADVLICAAPATQKTKNLIGGRYFRRMKKDSILINVSRGSIINTADLTRAVRAGKFRGVGLDVTFPEPLPSAHPLRQVPRVIITPHIAGPSDQNRERCFELICENMRRYLAGERLYNIVDKREGY